MKIQTVISNLEFHLKRMNSKNWEYRNETGVIADENGMHICNASNMNNQEIINDMELIALLLNNIDQILQLAKLGQTVNPEN